MKALQSHEVRQMFLDFFEGKGHKPVRSASLVPVEDPSLLWINSGVATLKKYFDGTLKPDNPRIVSSQKSIRTNDIENVGKTARHHTLFEMLGNFSIGDYFKEEAVEWAWEFLTSDKWLDLDPERLYVTVYPQDQETKQIWINKIGLDEDHIIEEEGNFWDIGAGPSGPDSEIFYDRGESYNNLSEDDPENYPGGENERWLEIWNLVFSEFNHKEDDTYEPLPNRNIDTGMGLERIVSVLQDAPTNFETDLFLPIIKQVEAISGKGYGDKQEESISFKVIADHIRAVTFAIGDGALPSNEGRGYVLRRLLRRSVMHGRKLGIDKPFLSDLVPVVGEIMEEHYPEVKENTEFISRVVENEENRFHETINDGLDILNELILDLKKAGKDQIQGSDAFRLYDTYGFPFELTEEFAEEANLSVDLIGFEKEMEKQRERARSARSEDQSMSIQSGLLTEVTEESNFVGYDQYTSKSNLVHILDETAILEQAEPGATVKLVFDSTPFYSEKGGQVADTGVIANDQGETVAVVKDVQSAPAGQPLHITEVKHTIKVDETYHLTIDVESRLRIMRNHTATHLLHQALKDILGSHANQAGSLVASDVLRFDFTHFGQVTSEELMEMEQLVNEKIWASLPVETVETNLEEAKKMGAMALFGEKYGDNVRVVLIGDYSKELCGGTHVRNTSEIGLFKILSESGIGAGVRRIVAKTSAGAYQWLEEQQAILHEATNKVKAQTVTDLPEKIQHLQNQLKDLQNENESMQAKLTNSQAEDVFNTIEEANGYTYIASEVDVKDMAHLRQLADQWKQQNLSDVLVLGLRTEGKANLLVAMNQETVSKGLKSGDLIKSLAPMIGGGGGGRPDMAQAGGKNPDGFPEALSFVPNWLEKNG